MSDTTVRRLEQELGAANVIADGNERLSDYGRDESGLPSYPLECAALCNSAEEVRSVLRIAEELLVPVTPRGAGSGKVGGCLPVKGGIVLSTEKMTAIKEIDVDDMVAVVEPGVITGELQARAEAQGLFYPPDPASLGYCSMGGNVACNAGGPRALKYGVTREYILGLDVSLVGGEQIRVGRRTAKGVTGYDFVAGFVGSEGTFGVTTEIVCKLIPKPPHAETLLALFGDLGAAGTAVSAVLKSGLVPRALELMDQSALDHVRPVATFSIPKNTKAAALIELDGAQEGLQAVLIHCGQMCEQAGATDVIVAQDNRQRESLWQTRRAISKSITDAHRFKVSEDICVPRGQLIEMLRRIETLKQNTGTAIACYGHAGDGNLHVNIPCDDDPDDPSVRERINQLVAAIFRDTIELRGTLSGEHGIGLTKRDYMPLEQSDAVLAWHRRWKSMWDPNNLLNPGKIVPPVPRGCHE